MVMSDTFDHRAQQAFHRLCEAERAFINAYRAYERAQHVADQRHREDGTTAAWEQEYAEFEAWHAKRGEQS